MCVCVRCVSVGICTEVIKKAFNLYYFLNLFVSSVKFKTVDLLLVFGDP